MAFIWGLCAIKTKLRVENKFEYLGVFYTINNYKFRKVLNIRRKGISQESPDLIVVMMNPGSSKPINGVDNNSVETHTKPDNTQSQIVAVIENFNYNYARVVNLSDVREPKSKKFYNLISKMEDANVNHSIFCDRRSKDFDELFIPNVPVIIAWGVDKKLENLAEEALEKLKNYNILGVKKELSKFSYYHPYQRTEKEKQKWVECVLKQLKHMDKINEFKERVLSKFTEQLTDKVFLMIQNDRDLMRDYLHLLENGSLKNINSVIAKEIKLRYNLNTLNERNSKPESFLIESYKMFETE